MQVFITEEEHEVNTGLQDQRGMKTVNEFQAEIPVRFNMTTNYEGTVQTADNKGTETREGGITFVVCES